MGILLEGCNCNFKNEKEHMLLGLSENNAIFGFVDYIPPQNSMT